MQCIPYKKWNYVTHSYDDYYVPVDKKLVFSDPGSLDTIINCCQCLKEIKFGDSYTSLEVHTEMGMGYAVCEDCYNQEWVRRNKLKETIKDITEPEEPKECCLCGKEINGFGNSPWPLRSEGEGRCCDDCNNSLVIPARIEMIDLP